MFLEFVNGGLEEVRVRMGMKNEEEMWLLGV